MNQKILVGTYLYPFILSVGSCTSIRWMRTLCTDLQLLSRPYRHCLLKLLPSTSESIGFLSFLSCHHEKESSAPQGPSTSAAFLSNQTITQQRDPDLCASTAHG